MLDSPIKLCQYPSTFNTSAGQFYFHSLHVDEGGDIKPLYWQSVHCTYHIVSISHVCMSETPGFQSNIHIVFDKTQVHFALYFI